MKRDVHNNKRRTQDEKIYQDGKEKKANSKKPELKERVWEKSADFFSWFLGSFNEENDHTNPKINFYLFQNVKYFSAIALPEHHY